MANQRYPPRDDAGIIAAGELFETNSAVALAAGLTAGDVARLTTAVNEAQAAMATHTTSQIAARSNRTAKDDKIAALEALLSEFNRRLQPLPDVDDQTRGKLGIPVYDTTPTEAGAPDVLPFIKIDTAMPLAHVVNFADEDGKGKPDGVKALEIFVKIDGDATGNIDEYRYLAQDTESPYMKEFPVADAGKQAHYMCCWVNSRGERGAFQMASATVTSLLSNSSL